MKLPELTTTSLRNQHSGLTQFLHPSKFLAVGSRVMVMSPYSRFKMCPLLLVALILSVGTVWPQTPDLPITLLQARIAQDVEAIRIAEQKHLPEAQQGALWEQLAMAYHVATEFSKAEDAYGRALHLLKISPPAAAEYASTLDNLASLYLAYGRLEDAERARKQALRLRQRLGDPTGIAISEVHMADIAIARHQFKKAELLAQRGLGTMESLPNPPRPAMISAFIALAYARCSRGRCHEGLRSAQQAVVFAHENFESGSPARGFALETLGFAEWKSGATQDAQRDMLQAVQILQAELASADPRLAGAMLQYKAFLVEAKRRVEAQQIDEQVTRMTSQTGASCRGCTISVDSLSTTLR